MTESSEFTEPAQPPRRTPARSRLMALLAAVAVAATAVVAFSAGSASAQTANSDASANEQQSSDSSDADAACDRDGKHRGGKHWLGGMRDTLADVLGIDADTLRDKLKAGSTLADIATEQGVDVSDVVDALVAAISEKAAEHDREIDTDELTAKITALVNGEKPERPEGDDGRHGRRGMPRDGKGSFGIGRWSGHGHSDANAATT